MATTIQVSESTRQMLEKIKEIENRFTFDDVIAELVRDKLKVPTSLFGKGKGKISKFKKEDRLRFHDL